MTKKNKMIFWTSEQLVTTGKEHTCDTVTGRTSCLISNMKATEIENIEDTFHLFFDDNMMNKIGNHTNNRINVESCNKSIDKYKWVKVTNKIELVPLFGLMYFRGLFNVNLYLIEDYFHQTVTSFLFLSCRKIVSDFCETIFALTVQKKDLNSGRLIILPPWEKFGSYSVSIWVSMQHFLSIYQLTKRYIQCNIRFRSVSII